MTTRDVVRVAVAAGVALALAFIVEHIRDAGRDAELLRLEGVVSRDSTARVAAAAKTDTAIAHADTTVRNSARADSGWNRARAAAARVPAIIASTKPDTVKIRELVATVDTLRIEGNSLQKAAAADTAAIVQLQVSFADERKTWKTERGDLARALQVSESRRRHWGLGATAGYGAVRDNAGVVRSGPSVTVGLTYRW
jgi:hypothetical protein